MSALCRFCGDEIQWARRADGKNVPINVAPSPRGTLRLNDTAIEQLGPLEVLATDEPLYVRHRCKRGQKNA